MRALIVTILLFTSASVNAQFESIKRLWESDLERAMALYDEQFYEESIEYFDKVNELQPLDANSYLQLADAHRRLGHLEEARTYYQAVDDVYRIEDENNLLFFAETLLSTGRLAYAREKFELYNSKYPGNDIVKNRLLGIEEYESFFKDSMYTTLSGTPLNTEHREFGLRRYGDTYAFTSAREKDLVIQYDHNRTAESLLDIYVITDRTGLNGELERIRLSNHFKSNDGPFSRYGNEVVVSRSLGYSKEEKVNNLGLFMYRVENGKWELDQPFTYNSSSYTLTHPSFSTGGDTLYYASNMHGGKGGTDIYYSVKVAGVWSEPMNAGAMVNTQGDEIFPFHDGKTLYFSSNGHPGIGGQDIYRININEDGESFVENMGSPINTGYDDFAVFMQGDNGYFASNRPDGKGYDDIYAFRLLPKPPPLPKIATFNLTVLDSLSGRALNDVELSLPTDEAQLDYTADSTGNYTFELLEGQYTILLHHDHYRDTELALNLERYKTYDETILMPPDINLDIIAPDSIMFKLGDYKLAPTAEAELDVIYESMDLYKNLTLKIEAHTDSRGRAEYNQWLSEMRAKSAADYLVSKGVENSRIVTEGFGESRLLNDCKDNVQCSDSEHKVNRRIEFILQKE